MTRRWPGAWALAGVVFAAACGGNVVDLGSNEGGAGGDGGSAGDAANGGSSGSGSSSGAVSPLSGTYKGYIESFSFPDGSDTVTMALVFAADGTVTGTVFFGDGPPLAPPTDPNVGYPPGVKGESNASLLEGFAFTVLDGAYAAPRLMLRINSVELWKRWCEMQTTVYPQYDSASPGGDDAGPQCGALLGYGCLPLASALTGSTCTWTSCDHPTPTVMDCGKLLLCQLNQCSCTATSCTIPPPVAPDAGTGVGSGTVSFDMQMGAGVLEGSETGIGSSVLNVHLVQSP